jgi:hypothetical protein
VGEWERKENEQEHQPAEAELCERLEVERMGVQSAAAAFDQT